MNRLKQSLAVDTETLFLDLITFLTQDEERFERFVALSGLGQHDFRAHLAEPTFQAMVLDQVLQEQNLVLEFATAHSLKPEAVLAARRKLPGGLAE